MKIKWIKRRRCDNCGQKDPCRRIRIVDVGKAGFRFEAYGHTVCCGWGKVVTEYLHICSPFRWGR